MERKALITGEEQLVVFRLGREAYGVDIGQVQGIEGFNPHGKGPHGPLFDPRGQGEQGNPREQFVQPLHRQDKAAVVQPAFHPDAVYHPAGFDFKEFARYNASALQGMADRRFSLKNMAQDHRRIEIPYHRSARSSSSFAKGSAAVRGASSSNT